MILAYSYAGNRLNSVTDTSTNYSGYPDTSGNTISYDDNGNMKDHTDKGVLQIDYNFLNLPDYIKFDKGLSTRTGIINENISYLYRADGTKLKKIYNYTPLVVDPLGTTTTLLTKITEYLDGFQYETLAGKKGSTNLILKFVPTAEGYYNFENNKYIYSYTDHLGNVRLSYTKNGSGGTEIIEENNFYPFGMKHEGYNTLVGNPSYNYGYNGKELQKETGWSDYGARMYMSDIGRWGVIDPLAETSRRFSPYNYALNNPISFIDPDGRKATINDLEFSGGYAPAGGGFDFYGNGGYGAVTGDFLYRDPFSYLKNMKGSAINIIINFLRGDKEGLGNFVNSDFTANGWHVIDASSLKDALTKLASYLGDSKADNIYINSHGYASQRYVLDDNGEIIPDPNSETGYKMTGDTGFYTGTDGILGSHMQQYISDKDKLSSDALNSINSLVGIANYVKDGKNLIMGSCWTARYDDLLGSGLSSAVQSRDIFVNRDYSSLWPIGGKIRFQDFIGFNQTSQDKYIKGWVRYRDGAAAQQNFNIIMTKYGVKTIK